MRVQNNKILKKLMALFLCLGLVTGMSGCSFSGEEKEKIVKYTPKPEETANSQEKPVILSDEKASELADEFIDEMTLEEKVGQMFIVNLEQLDNTKGDYYEHKKCTQEMMDRLHEYGVGGTILFSRNVSNPNQVKELIGDINNNSSIHPFVCVDEEGGSVARIASNKKMKTTAFPSAQEIGKKENGDYVYEMGRTIGGDIAQFGFNVNFAPVADVNTSKLNTEIGDRSFGANPEKVSEFVSAFVQGLHQKGIMATLKHFPGQGASEGDTHKGSVDIDSSITGFREKDFKPFQAGIEAGADFVMVSHISVSRVTETETPASMSELIMQTILREELGYHGIIVTDALDMSSITEYYTAAEAAVETIKAGADMVLMPVDFKQAYQGVLGAIEEGKISKSRINESVLRILTAKFKYGILKKDAIKTWKEPTPEPTATIAPTPKKEKKKKGKPGKKNG